jgi:hypothetical protein
VLCPVCASIDLTLSVDVGTPFGGSATLTLVNSTGGSGVPSWQSGLVTVGGVSCQYTAYNSPGLGYLDLEERQPLIANDISNAQVITNSPFHVEMTLTVGGATLPKLRGTGANKAILDGVSATGGCLTTLQVQGCNSLALPGAAVSIYDHSGGTLLYSGTTDGSGNFSFDAPAGTAYAVVSRSRFNTSSTTVSLSPGGTTVVSLTPATGYHCVIGCPIPASDTLHGTHPKFGALTYTYSGGVWTTTFAYSYPGVGSCGPPGVRTVTCTWDGGTNYTESWKYDTTTLCPVDSGTGTETVAWTTAGAGACPPSLLVNVNHTPTGAIEQNMYAAAPMSFGITE